MKPELIWLLRVQPRNPATGAEIAVRLAGGGTRGYTQFGGAAWWAGLERPSAIVQRLGYSDGEFGEGAIVQALELRWGGTAKRASTLASYYWPNAKFTLHSGPDGGSDANFTQVLAGRIADVTGAPGRLSLQMADPSKDLERPVLGAAAFAGTGGVEGIVELKGRPKRRAVGRCRNVELWSLDPANNIWVATDPARPLFAIDQLYDRGNAASSLVQVAWAGTVAATLAALAAAACPQGGGAVAPSIGCIKWWFANPGRLTCDLRGEIGGAYIDTPADIAAWAVAAVNGPVVKGASLIEARALRNVESGRLISGEESAGSVLNDVLGGVSLWWGMTSAGELEFGVWAFGAPVGTIVAASVTRGKTHKPVKKLTLGYRRNYTALSRSEIAASVLDDLNVLTITEKTSVLIPKEERREIEYSDWTNRATILVAAAPVAALSAAITSVNTKRTARLTLLNAIVPAWNDVTANSPINRTAYDASDREYDDMLSWLKTLISEEDARRASVDPATGNLIGDGTNVANGLVANALVPIGSFSVIRGNTVSKLGGTHGAFEGGAVGTAFVNTAFVSSSLLNVAAGQSWETHLSLDDDATSFAVASLKVRARYTGLAVGSGVVSLFVDNVQVAGPVAVFGLSAASRMMLAYDGVRYFVIIDGVIRCQVAAAANLRLWPKVIDFYSGLTITDVQYGAWSDNAWASIAGSPNAPADNATSGDNFIKNPVPFVDSSGWVLDRAIREIASAGDPVAAYFKVAAGGTGGLTRTERMRCSSSKLFISSLYRSGAAGAQFQLSAWFFDATGAFLSNSLHNFFPAAANVWQRPSSPVINLPAGAAEFYIEITGYGTGEWKWSAVYASTSQFGATDDRDRTLPNVLPIDEKIRSLIPKEQRREIEYSDWSNTAILLNTAATTSALVGALSSVATKRTAWLALRNAITPAWDDINANSLITRTTYDIADREYDDMLSWLKAVVNEALGQRAAVDANGLLIGSVGVEVDNNLINTLISPAGRNFTANQNGVLDTNQLPETFQFKLLRGATDVSSTTTWSVTAQPGVNGGAVTISNGILTIPAGRTIALSASISITAVRNGVTRYGIVSLSRSDSAASQNGSSTGGTTGTDNTLNSVSGTTMVAISDEIQFSTGSAGVATFGGLLAINAAAEANAGAFGARLRWKIKPVGGSYTDVGTVISQNFQAEVVNEGGFISSSPGEISAVASQAGLTANAAYVAQLFGARDTASPIKTIGFGGSVSATGS